MPVPPRNPAPSRRPVVGRSLERVPELAVPAARPAQPQPRTRVPRAPSAPGPGALRLVLVPAAITLLVTLLRLGGELRGWSPEWFSRLPGGGLAIVGITWLPPFVGAWMAFRMVRAGVRPPPIRDLVVWPLGALLLGLAMGYGFERLVDPSWTGTLALWALVGVVSGLIAFVTWPAIGRPLLLYALFARLPVVVVMWFAISGRWGTHYDVPAPGFPALLPLQRWLWSGVLPQLTIWIAYTLALGMLGAALGIFVAARRRRG